MAGNAGGNVPSSPMAGASWQTSVWEQTHEVSTMCLRRLTKCQHLCCKVQFIFMGGINEWKGPVKQICTAVYRLYDSQGDLAAEMANAVLQFLETMSCSLKALCLTPPLSLLPISHVHCSPFCQWSCPSIILAMHCCALGL